MPILLFLFACAPCDSTVITVSMNVTTDEDGNAVAEGCYDTDDEGVNYADCCPDGYAFLARAVDGVLCEEVCGLDAP